MAYYKIGRVVIPMIAFIEGDLRIPMGRVTRDFLIAHKLCPIQCATNIFRILGSVDALNEKMGVNLTHHDINWVYNSQHLKGQGYYLKARVLKVRLISCLLDINKGMDKDFLIVLGEWHDGLHCLIRDRKPGGVLRFRLNVLTLPILLLTTSFLLLLLFSQFVILFFFYSIISYSINIFVFGEFVDKYSTILNLNLVNEPDLTRIL